MDKLLYIFFFIPLYLTADEGMWLLPELKELTVQEMKAMGLRLHANQLYNTEQISLKDAVPVFNNMCTSEIISSNGLLLTNHHCGFEFIQHHSTVQKNYLDSGFWAKNYAEELPNPGLTVSFLVYMQNVTNRVMDGVGSDMMQKNRDDIIKNNIQKIIDSATKNSDYIAEVPDFFHGNEYYLIVTEEYRDVRLVGTPPVAVGKFGGDTDNWMWPRHTGDFCFFRVYCSPEGRPADYAKENVPLKPKHFLPVSIKGIKENDFTMVIGYPGKTERYASSFEIEELMKITHPNRIFIRGTRQEVLKKYMETNDSVYIKYASKYSSSSNYWKYSIGQNQWIEKLHLIEKKKMQEKKFTEWVNEEDNRKKLYDDLLNNMERVFREREVYKNAIQHYHECVFEGIDLFDLAIKSFPLTVALLGKSMDKEKRDAAIIHFISHAEIHFKNYDMHTDKAVAKALLHLLFQRVDKKCLPLSALKKIKRKYNNDYSRFVDDLYAQSVFADKNRLDIFLRKPTAEKLRKDPVMLLLFDLIDAYSNVYDTYKGYVDQLSILKGKYMKAQMEMYPQKIFYPDANFSMRLSYGTVKSYFPADAIFYNYVTTHKGIIEKNIPGNKDFSVPDKIMENLRKEQFAPYGGKELYINFITNNDITGGNSGSPVLNGNGELVGLAFDGNWEAMTGDIEYIADKQRCIAVDIRYILYFTERVAGAANIINELTIVK